VSNIEEDKKWTEGEGKTHRRVGRKPLKYRKE
jgi:hypothetical protein